MEIRQLLKIVRQIVTRNGAGAIARIRRRDFRGANFERIDFYSSNFHGANFSGTDFEGASFLGANFERSYFDEDIRRT